MCWRHTSVANSAGKGHALTTALLPSLGKKGQLDGCPVCSLPLPLRLPELGEQGKAWQCAGCAARYFAVISDEASDESLRNARLLPESDAWGNETTWSFGAPPSLHDSKYQTVDEIVPNRKGIRSPVETPTSRQFDAAIMRGSNLSLRPQGTPFSSELRDCGAGQFHADVIRQFLTRTDDATARLADFFSCLEKGKHTEADVLHTISEEALLLAAHDMDLFVALGMHVPEDGYPSRHSIRVGRLAMAIGANMGYDKRTLLELGIGCLVQDVGMLMVDRQAYDSTRILTASEFAEVTKHPVLTFEVLNKHMDWVPSSARMVAYQVHERCDGSGYPRGRTSQQIHELAKVAAVADVFVALLSPRPHRGPMIPYYAMEKIVYDAKGGLFDPDVVRALLQTVSLFPIGSWVELSDGRPAQVIRAGGDQWARPVVDAWRELRTGSRREVINLATCPQLHILRPLAENQLEK